MQVLAQKGGAIVKPKKRSPKKQPKIEQAIQRTMQFHDSTHKYLHQNLTGRGGRFDKAHVRERMHDLMKRFDPEIFHSYLSGKVRMRPTNFHDRVGKQLKPQIMKDPEATIRDFGGSLKSLSHSENGLLVSHDSTFYHHVELV